MLPEFVRDSYKQYKSDTDRFATWLVNVASKCSPTVVSLDPVNNSLESKSNTGSTAEANETTSEVPAAEPDIDPSLSGQAKKNAKKKAKAKAAKAAARAQVEDGQKVRGDATASNDPATEQSQEEADEEG